MCDSYKLLEKRRRQRLFLYLKVQAVKGFNTCIFVLKGFTNRVIYYFCPYRCDMELCPLLENMLETGMIF